MERRLSEATPRYLLTIYPEAEGGFTGFYQPVLTEERIPFTGLSQLLLSMDENIRAGGETLAAERMNEEAVWQPAERRRRRAPHHFLITIRSCRNATWQGEVHCREKHLRREFRSCLELTRMIEDAITGRKA